jgi:hypothetical protein
MPFYTIPTTLFDSSSSRFDYSLLPRSCLVIADASGPLGIAVCSGRFRLLSSVPSQSDYASQLRPSPAQSRLLKSAPVPVQLRLLIPGSGRFHSDRSYLTYQL